VVFGGGGRFMCFFIWKAMSIEFIIVTLQAGFCIIVFVLCTPTLTLLLLNRSNDELYCLLERFLSALFLQVCWDLGGFNFSTRGVAERHHA
jgi:hypothetical protein